jgi:hypothetical protein
MEAQVYRNLELTKEQMEAFKKLWFIYGNNGKKHTLFNHKAIQGFLEANENRLEVYSENRKKTIREDLKNIQNQIESYWLTDECKLVCEYVLKSDFKNAFEISEL